MQSMLNLPGTYGLPLSVSGITLHLEISEELADHDRRREAIKKQRSKVGETLHGNTDLGIQRNVDSGLGHAEAGQVDEDLASDLQGLSSMGCAAKAA
ncbi:hypothetical protein K2173_016500 [Erythroxylum novogranatense]|uniref:Uncharacterized protein n=1 Tax=Erythroxylum novogranatense TaxID=1862640 RepID=A0AAV8SGG0_9ROSI|nr:hypothetical protein K2173_016500 [Erythroxylum novogranatense]